MAFKNSAKSSNGNFIDNFGKTYNGTTAITLPTTYTELDLGQEHSITSVSVYSTYTGTPSLTSLPTANRTLQGASVTLMDAYYNRVPRTLAGLGSQYNNTWPLGASLGPYYQSPPTGVTVVPGTDGAIWSFPITEQIVGTICYVDTEYDMPCFQTLLTVDATLSGYNWIAQSTDAMQSTIRTALTLINPNRGLTRFREGMRNVKLQLSYMETVGSGMNQAETSIQHVHTLSEVSRILKAVANSCSIGPQPS